jgi:small-conductance mechanosensitive channel
MTEELVSQTMFAWIVTGLTGGVAGAWFFYDIINLLRVRRADGADPLIRDRRFGYLVGIVIGFAGVLGCLRFHDVV